MICGFRAGCIKILMYGIIMVGFYYYFIFLNNVCINLWV